MQFMPAIHTVSTIIEYVYEPGRKATVLSTVISPVVKLID